MFGIRITGLNRFFHSDGSLNVRALGRMITRIENEPKSAEKLLSEIYQENDQTLILGVTGASGVGKSLLTDGLIKKYRDQGKKVAVIAVDPSSPFSGGAILGDRIRMQMHATDPGVFIRSMGTRGCLGGLAPATFHVLNLLVSVGFEVVIVETVGAGQDEIDILQMVDTVLLVLAPGLGDDIQVLKSGIMEIADIFVVNKADRPGIEQLKAEINLLLAMKNCQPNWVPPIIETVATEYKGLDELVSEITRHSVLTASQSDEAKLSKYGNRLRWMVYGEISAQIHSFLKGDEKLNSWIHEVEMGKINPYKAIHDFDKNLEINWDSRS
jgi:LAO/AO transport system kinase